MRPVLMASFALFTALASCSFVGQLWAQPASALDDSCASAKANGSHQFTGMADYYHHSLYGKKTASGQVLAKHLYTAAHRTLPFGTHVHVKNHSNGRSCVVVINDRGPFTKSKVIDLSHSAATELDMISAGTCKVGCTVVPKPKNMAAKPEPVKVAALVKAKEVPASKPESVATKPELPASKPEPVAISEPETTVRQTIAMKPVKTKPAAPAVTAVLNTAPASKDLSRRDETRADETSAELEGAVPVKWTEIQ
ncbi:MAG: septal ring lytic transglycosylase RlpA family protein [Candidatus Obscuribacterales bacterium]